MSAPPRHLVLWLPDWPVRAALGAPPGDEPVAVVQANTVVACSASARAQGVRRGQRRRLAQTSSPGLRILPADPLQEQRMFLPVLRLLEELVPGVQPLRPGLIALRARGAARYYGARSRQRGISSTRSPSTPIPVPAPASPTGCSPPSRRHAWPIRCAWSLLAVHAISSRRFPCRC